jgi:thermostable 8-oxoguanine DNA glycosylase
VSEWDSIREIWHQRESDLRKRLDGCVKRGNSKDHHELFKWLCKNILSPQVNWDDVERSAEALDKDGCLWNLGAQQMADALWKLGYALAEEKKRGAETDKGRRDRANKGKWLVRARERFFGSNNPDDILVWVDKLRVACAENPVEARNRLADRQQPDHLDGMGMKVSSHFLRGLGFSRNELAILDYWVLKWLVRDSVIAQTEADGVARDKGTYAEVESKMKRWDRAAGNAPPLDVLDWLLWRRPGASNDC